LRRQYHDVVEHSGVGVLDKSVAVLSALARGPASLADLVQRTGLPRPTAYRLAAALEVHRLVARDATGRFALGPGLGELASAAGDPLLLAARDVLAGLRDETGESAQLYRREPGGRRCIAAVDRGGTGLADVVPVGALLSLSAGSAAQVLLAWSGEDPPPGAAYTARTLAEVRRRGWAASVGERERGLASVSAPVRDATGAVVAALSVSGPAERLGRSPGPGLGPLVARAAAALHP
jgi:DNA-binding IclR family transcriptional regulator